MVQGERLSVRLHLDDSGELVKTVAERPRVESGNVALPWIGESYCAQIDGTKLTKIVTSVFSRSMVSEMQQRAWSNLAILNEWKKRYPDKDPVEVHEKLWQVRLIDPAGGTYAWNAALGTMESSTYGCPEAPKAGPALPPGLKGIKEGNFGVTFEEQGLRARGELYWEGK